MLFLRRIDSTDTRTGYHSNPIRIPGVFIVGTGIIKGFLYRDEPILSKGIEAFLASPIKMFVRFVAADRSGDCIFKPVNVEVIQESGTGLTLAQISPCLVEIGAKR